MGMILQDRYEIKRSLGTGENSVVYQAYDRILLQDAAIKEIDVIASVNADDGVEANKSSDADKSKNAILREAGLIFGKYELKGFPELKEVFSEGDKVYLVMELLTGKTLREYLKGLPQHRMKAENAVEMLVSVLEALSFLHAEGVAHCGISGENIFVREDGTCCLMGIGTLWRKTAVSNYLAAPEVLRKPEWKGPWSDVWGISAVLYEMISGKAIENGNGNEKKSLGSHLRKLSDFVEINAQIEQAVHQGLNTEIQQRFFSIYTFVERMKFSSVKNSLEMYQGKIQKEWGEKWLTITAGGISNEVLGEKGQKVRGWTKKRKKKAVAAGILAGVAAVCCTAGILWYEAQPITHGKLLKKLENIEEKWEYSDAVLYNVTKEFVKENNLESDYLHKFAVKKDELEKWAETYLDGEFSETVDTTWDGYIYVYKDVLQRTDVACYETETYETEYKGEQLQIEWKYDVVNETVTGVGFRSTKEITAEILEEILPVLVPEAYLNEAEISGYYKMAEEEMDGYYWNNTHGKYALSLNCWESMGNLSWKVNIGNYLNPKRENEESVRAGNYARDSKEYETYVTFLEEHAESTEEIEDGMMYVLDEAAVQEWGQISNVFLLDVTADEVMDKLEEEGRRLELEKESLELTAESYQDGAIMTSFLKDERYQDDKDMEIIIRSDYLSGKISCIAIYHRENNLEEMAELASEIIELISEDVEVGKTEQYFLSQLESYADVVSEPGSEGKTASVSLADCGYSLYNVNDYKNIGVFFEHHCFSWAENGYAPYDWM